MAMSLAERAFRACRLPSRFRMEYRPTTPVKQETAKFLADAKTNSTSSAKFMVVYGNKNTGKKSRIGQAVAQWCKKPKHACVYMRHQPLMRPIDALLDQTRVHQLAQLSDWKTKLALVFDASDHTLVDNYQAADQLKQIVQANIPVVLVCQNLDQAGDWAKHLDAKSMTKICASESSQFVVA
jgi:hypothetical protein